MDLSMFLRPLQVRSRGLQEMKRVISLLLVTLLATLVVAQETQEQPVEQAASILAENRPQIVNDFGNDIIPTVGEVPTAEEGTEEEPAQITVSPAREGLRIDVEGIHLEAATGYFLLDLE